MWGMPWSSLLAFVALILTVLAALIWAILSGREDNHNEKDGES